MPATRLIIVVAWHPAGAVERRLLRGAATGVALSGCLALHLAHLTFLAGVTFLPPEVGKGVNHTRNPSQACENEGNEIGAAPLVDHG